MPTISRFAIIIFVLALVIRLVTVIVLPLDAEDSQRYIRLADNLIKHRMLTFNGVDPTDRRAPGYPAFLAILFMFLGRSLLVVRIVQALIDSILCYMIYQLIVTLLKNDRLAFLTSLLAIFHPGMIAATSFILSETVTLFLLFSSVLLLLRACTMRRALLFVASGIVLGLSTLTRPVTFPYPFFFFVCIIPFIMKKKLRLSHVILFIAAFTVVLTPWIMRNAYAFGRFIPVGSNLGGNLYIGSNPDWDGAYNPDIVALRHDIERDIHHTGPGHYPVDDILKERALARIASDPLLFMRLCLKKVGRFWLGIPGSVVFLKDRIFLQAGVFGYYYLLLGLSLCGIVFGFTSGKNMTALFILLSVIIFFTLIHSLLVALPRYRLTIDPLLIVFSSYSIQAIAVKLKNRSLLCKWEMGKKK